MTEKYKYSPAERELLELIPARGGRIDSGELTERYYANKKKKPFYGKIFINSSMRTLMEKAEANKEKFRVFRSDTKPYEYWRTGRL